MTVPFRVSEHELKVPGRIRIDPIDPKGQWPRMLGLEEDVEKQLSEWLTREIDSAIFEREDVVEDWKKWQMQYWAQPETPVKNFPFRRAANVVVPLTAIAVEAVHARLMNTIFAVEPFWSVRARTRNWLAAAKPAERWLQSEVENENSLNVYEFSNDSLMELVKLGTAVGKSGYERSFRKTLIPTGDGRDEPSYVERKNGATLEYVPVANFITRAADMDPQEAAWVAEEHMFTWGQMKRMVQAGRMNPEALEKIKSWVNEQQVQPEQGTGDDYQRKIDELMKNEPLWDTRFRVHEVWASFDVDEDTEDEEIVLDFHKPSGTFLSIRYNWYSDMHRPYRVTQYVRVEGRIWGIGVGKQNEQFQEIITTVHRQRLDNATLANMRMLAVRKQSGISPDEPIFPGKMWFVDDPQRDVQVLQLSEVYRSALVNEDVLLRYSERRTGVNEVLLGLPPQGTPGTATGDLARIAEGNKRFDLVLKNIRRWFSLLGQDVLANYQQFGDQQRHWLILENNGQFVEQVLNFPREAVRRGAAIELTATSSIVNRQVEQQQWLSLFQVISGYYDRIIQLGQLFNSPELFLAVAQRAVMASDEAMRRLLETFDVTDAERLLFLPENEGGPGGEGGTEADETTVEGRGEPQPSSRQPLDPRLISVLRSLGLTGLGNVVAGAGGSQGNGS